MFISVQPPTVETTQCSYIENSVSQVEPQ